MNATSYSLLHDMKLYLSYLLVRKTSTSVLKLLTVGARVFFSKFLMGGTQNFRSPSVPDGDEVGWGGDTCKRNLTEAKLAHLMQN